jgi:hypothetical protein
MHTPTEEEAKYHAMSDDELWKRAGDMTDMVDHTMAYIERSRRRQAKIITAMAKACYEAADGIDWSAANEDTVRYWLKIAKAAHNTGTGMTATKIELGKIPVETAPGAYELTHWKPREIPTAH